MPDRDMDCVKEADVNDSDEEDIAAIENAENEPEDHSKKQKQRSTPPADSSTDLVKALRINRNKKEALLKAICKRTPQNTVACPLCPADFLDMQHLLRHLCTSAHFLHQIKALRHKDMEQFLELGNQKCPSCGVHVARKNRGSLIRHFGVCHGDAMDLALEAARKVEDSIAEELKSANSLPADATTVVPPPHSPPPSGAVSPAPSPPAHPCSDVPFEPGSLLHPAAAHAPPPEPQHTVPAHAPPHPSTVLSSASESPPLAPVNHLGTTSPAPASGMDLDMDCDEAATDVMGLEEEDVSKSCQPSNAEQIQAENLNKTNQQQSIFCRSSLTDFSKEPWRKRSERMALFRVICKGTVPGMLACPLCPADGFPVMSRLIEHLCSANHFLGELIALRREETKKFLQLGIPKCPRCGVRVARINRHSLMRHFGISHGDAINLALEAVEKAKGRLGGEAQSTMPNPSAPAPTLALTVLLGGLPPPAPHQAPVPHPQGP